MKDEKKSRKCVYMCFFVIFLCVFGGIGGAWASLYRKANKMNSVYPNLNTPAYDTCQVPSWSLDPTIPEEENKAR